MNQTKETKLLLLFGMPRSGTTWLGKLVDSSPEVLYLHEPDSVFKLRDDIPLILTKEHYFKYRNKISFYVNQLTNRCSIKVNGKLPFFNKIYLPKTNYFLFKKNIILAKILSQFKINIPILNPFNNNSKKILAWKSIESCGRVGLILDTIPSCKLVFIIRHPCGHITSIINGEKNNSFSGKILVSDDLHLFELLLKSHYAIQNNITLDKIKLMSPIERLALRWIILNDHAMREISKFSENSLIIKYEDLCKNPVMEVKNIFQFSGISWNKQTESFIKQSTHNESTAYYSVFKNPKTAMNSWKSTLSHKDIELIRQCIANSKPGQLFINDF